MAIPFFYKRAGWRVALPQLRVVPAGGEVETAGRHLDLLVLHLQKRAQNGLKTPRQKGLEGSGGGPAVRELDAQEDGRAIPRSRCIAPFNDVQLQIHVLSAHVYMYIYINYTIYTL